MEARDNHLRKAEFFDVEKYPKLSFKSTKITTTNKEGYLFMFGVITIKDVSKEISFPFKQTSKDGGVAISIPIKSICHLHKLQVIPSELNR